jgi:hypothetical protein
MVLSTECSRASFFTRVTVISYLFPYMQVCCQLHISVRLISGKVKPGDKYGLIAIKLGIPAGSFHERATLKRGWGANRRVGYLLNKVFKAAYLRISKKFLPKGADI